MPAIPSWFQRLGEILEVLRSLEAPFLDRAAVEQLFGVRRRRAHQLMAAFGGYQAGKAFLVDRGSLIRALENLRAGAPFQWEARRSRRVAEALTAARREWAARRVQIPAAQSGEHRGWSGLPEGIQLQPGELRIAFASAEDLLRKLFDLSQAIAHDYEGFLRHAGGE